MVQERTPDPWSRPAEPPSVVQITILADPAPRPLRERVAHTHTITRARVIAALVIIGATVVGLLVVPHRAGVNAQASDPGAPGVAAAYGYPPRCLSVTFSLSDPRYARADFDRASACGRYDGYATAIFHRVDGAWRPVLVAITYPCPNPALPERVQENLGVCP